VLTLLHQKLRFGALTPLVLSRVNHNNDVIFRQSIQIMFPVEKDNTSMAPLLFCFLMMYEFLTCRPMSRVLFQTSCLFVYKKCFYCLVASAFSVPY
jgi:hypothetical protein